MDDFVKISFEVPVDELDLQGLALDVLPIIKAAVERYEEWNQEKRDDGIIMHTDALDDFVGFIERGFK